MCLQKVDYITLDKDILDQEWFEIHVIESKVTGLGKFCLVVEFHRGGSATSGATSSRFLFGN